MNRIATAAVAALVICAGTAFAEQPNETKGDKGRAKLAEPRAAEQEQVQSQMTVNRAADVYRRLVKSDTRAIPQDVLNQGQCIAVFPNVDQAALVVGGKSGHGVATCKNPQGKWSNLAFLSLTGGSLGAQVGVKSSDIVMVFRNDTAANRLRSGTFTLGGDVSVSMGRREGGADVTTDRSDVYALADTSGGAYVGASLTGTVIRPDNDARTQFYGSPVEHQNALSDFSDQNRPQSAVRFIQLLPTSRPTLDESIRR